MTYDIKIILNNILKRWPIQTNPRRVKDDLQRRFGLQYADTFLPKYVLKRSS